MKTRQEENRVNFADRADKIIVENSRTLTTAPEHCPVCDNLSQLGERLHRITMVLHNGNNEVREICDACYDHLERHCIMQMPTPIITETPPRVNRSFNVWFRKNLEAKNLIDGTISYPTTVAEMKDKSEDYVQIGRITVDVSFHDDRENLERDLKILDRHMGHKLSREFTPNPVQQMRLKRAGHEYLRLGDIAEDTETGRMFVRHVDGFHELAVTEQMYVVETKFFVRATTAQDAQSCIHEGLNSSPAVISQASSYCVNVARNIQDDVYIHSHVKRGMKRTEEMIVEFGELGKKFFTGKINLGACRDTMKDLKLRMTDELVKAEFEGRKGDVSCLKSCIRSLGMTAVQFAEMVNKKDASELSIEQITHCPNCGRSVDDGCSDEKTVNGEIAIVYYCDGCGSEFVSGAELRCDFCQSITRDDLQITTARDQEQFVECPDCTCTISVDIN